MTVPATTRRAGPFAGTGSSMSCPFTFKVFSAADIQVRKATAAGVESVVTSGLTITINADQDTTPGGSVALTAASGETVVIVGATPYSQTLDLPSGGNFSPLAVESALDRAAFQIQQLAEETGRGLRLPATAAAANTQLPAPQANRYLGWNNAGTALENRESTGAASAADVTFEEAGAAAIQRAVQLFLRELCVNVKNHGAVGDGVTDDSAAFQAAFGAAAGRKVYAPDGHYLLNTGLSNITAGGVFTKGLSLIGDGPDKTILDFRGSTQAINVDTDTTLEFQMFVRIEQLKIVGSSATGAADGIRLRRAYMVTLDHVWITGFPGDGVAVVMNEGDADGSNMVHMRQCRIENCGGWGINGDVTGPYNEFSFMLLEHTFIQQCGTASASTPPPSGGIRWKGQVLHALDSAVVICENVGVFLQGGSGLANTATLTNFVLENNRKRGLYCTGIDGLTWDRGQLYNNDAYTATELVEFDGSTSTIRNVRIEGLIVRATSGNNPCTAFKISGANAELNSCRVRNTSWQNFDYAGQSRFNGWQFDHVPQTCGLVALSATSILFRPDQNFGGGNTTPYRLRGINAGSSSGEWVPLQLAAAGLSRTNSGLAANTRYYIYLYDNANVPSLEIAGTAFVTDAATGYPVKDGDATRLYVGSVETDGSSQFRTSAGGWLNPLRVPGSQTGAQAWMWMDSSNRLRVRYALLPTSDTDGTVVGTQT